MDYGPAVYLSKKKKKKKKKREKGIIEGAQVLESAAADRLVIAGYILAYNYSLCSADDDATLCTSARVFL